jgi:hypothetical protein
VVASAPIVFIGTVIRLPAQAGEAPATVVFRVDEIWRGATIPPTVGVETNLGGVPTVYRVGEAYLVVPQALGSALVDSCTATQVLRTEHLQLRPPGAHLPDGTPIQQEPADPGPSLPLLVGVILTGAGLLGLLLMIGGTAAAHWRLPLVAWLGAAAVAGGGAVFVLATGGPGSNLAADPSGSAPASSASPDANPPVGDVLVEISQLTGMAPSDHLRVVVTEDGLVAENQGGTYLQRRLGPDAMAALRAALFESGAFDANANLFPRLLPGIEEPPHDGVVYDIVVHHPAGEVRIAATPYFMALDAYEPNPPLDQALALATSLHVDGQPLGLDSWTDAAATPYQAANHRLQVGQGFPDTGTAADLAEITWPLDRPIDQIGPAVELSAFEGSLACAVIDADAADSLLRQVQLQGVALGASPSTRADFVIQDLTAPAAYAVVLTPLLPGDAACEPYPSFDVPSGPPATPTLEVGATAEIRVDELRLRSEPTTAGEVVGRSVAGDRVLVSGGPQGADGFIWFQVRLGEMTGWVATGPAEDPWLVPSSGDPALVVLRLDTCTLVCDEILWYPGADPSEALLLGRIVDDESGALGVQALITDAHDLLGELLATGLLDESIDHELPALLPGAEPCACGEIIVRTFVIRRDAEIVRVSWGIPPEAHLYQEQPEAERLSQLADRLAAAVGQAIR